MQDAEAAAEELRERMQAGRAKQGLRVKTLVARTGLSRTTVSQALNFTSGVPSEQTVALLARELRLDADLLLKLQRAACSPQAPDARRASGAFATHRDALTESVATLGPVVLEVHDAVTAGKSTETGAGLTPYLARAHDAVLREELAAVLAGGASRLIMLTGGSSTGKTRALYEALVARAPHVPLLHPADKTALAELLNGGLVKPGCVLWLNEAQRFLFGEDGEQAAGLLRAVLKSTHGIVMLGTLWTDPYWNQLTTAHPGDPHAQARALLMQPGSVRLHVPNHLSAQDLNAWQDLADASGDPRLKEALAAATSDGRVIQRLSGGPELLQAYLDGPDALFTEREHALLTAALDARRLGHMSPLPAALLAEAADGDLPARARAADPHWAQQDLDALTTGRRTDASRTDIRHTLTALVAVRARAGAQPGYEPADYLDQHTRSRRADQLGSPGLWRALIEHTADPGDQDRLARAAWDRGLRTTAARLWHKAVTAGHPTTGLAQLGPHLDPAHEAATFSATHADLTNPVSVAMLLGAFRESGAEQAITVLLERNPATHTDPTNPAAVIRLLEALRSIGAQQTAVDLAERTATNVDLTNPDAIARLLKRFRAVGAERAITLLLERDPAAHTDSTRPATITRLLEAFRSIGARQMAVDLAERAASHADLSDPDTVDRLDVMLVSVGARHAAVDLTERAATCIDLANPAAVERLLGRWRVVGREQAVAALLERDPAAHADPTDPTAVARLLEELQKAGPQRTAADLAWCFASRVDMADTKKVVRLLEGLRQAGAQDAVAALLERDPAAHADLTNPDTISWLLEELQKVGPERTVVDAAARFAAHVDVTDTDKVARLLRGLRQARAKHAITVLLERDPAAHADLTDPDAVARLMEELRQAWAEHAVTVLLGRHPAAYANLTDPYAVAWLLSQLRQAGAQDAVAALLERDPAAHADLTDPDAVAELMKELRQAGAEQAVVDLAGRAAAHADLASSDKVAWLLKRLREAGAEQAVAALLERDPAAHADLTNRFSMGRLIKALREAGAEQMALDVAERAAAQINLTDSAATVELLAELRHARAEQAVAALLERDPAAYADLTNRAATARLLEALREAGAEQSAAVLGARRENAGYHREHFAPHGREPDGQRTPSWTWHDVAHELRLLNAQT